MSAYLISFLTAFFVTVLTAPFLRRVAVKFNILDNPSSQIKTHKTPTPYLGGLAIFFGWCFSLIVIRLITNFPTGTLRSLRAIMTGAAIICLLGLIDDIKKNGLGVYTRLVVQIIAAAIVVFLFDVRVQFIANYPLSDAVSILWIVAITNAFNIIDIMDGLSSGIGAIAAAAFLFISLPSEMIYVNFICAALLGSTLGFLPHNLRKNKMFMGDAGSMLLGFVLAVASVGTQYTQTNMLGIFAPLLILALPIYETAFVSLLRIKRKMSPLSGSKDHYALRLEQAGFSRKKIVVLTYIFCMVLSLCAWAVTLAGTLSALAIFAAVGIILIVLAVKLSKIKI
jgi:UDP-GlcNAc:undecaprenyl-phosphate GlcNAc-1-phosphate transferase